MPPCPDDIAIVADPSLPAKIVWTVIIVGVLAFELWALHRNKDTLSEYVQHKGRWVRWIAVGLVGLLGLHLWGWL